MARARRWGVLVAAALVAYAAVGWAVVRYGPRPHTVLRTRSGEEKLLGAKPIVDGGARRLQLYIDDPDGSGDEARAAEILYSVVPDRPSADLRSIGISFVQFHGVWPLTSSTAGGYVFARSPQGGWARADRDQLRDHLAAARP